MASAFLHGGHMLLDTTLREGEQSFGTYLSMADRERILLGLAEVGVAEAEVGWAGREDLADMLALSARVAPGLAAAAWCRCRPEDLRTAAACGARRVCVGVPVSDAHLARRLGVGRPALLDLLAATLAEARALGIRHVTVGMEDASRADRDFVFAVARHAAAHGAHRVRLSDTVGLFTPLEVADMVRGLRAALDATRQDATAPRARRVSIGTHFHNDCGMATANALTALECGADCADVSVLGLGERAGVARLEELAAALVVRGRANLDLAPLRGLCAHVAQAAGLSVPRHWPVAGRDIFAVESGLHAHGVRRDPSLFEPFPPALVGGSRRLGVGRKSGVAAVAAALAELSILPPPDALPAIVDAVRECSARLRRPLTPAELASIASDGRVTPEKLRTVGTAGLAPRSAPPVSDAPPTGGDHNDKPRQSRTADQGRARTREA
ncbi:HMGL-like family protein [Desulfovibrio sp. A2]|nr:HMGL-like family protein [Desulfovibrio sp. A2]